MNDVPVSESDLRLQLEVYAAKPKADQPEIQIQAADNAEYEVVARVLADAKGVGMEKIGFLNTD
jgi:biopolymer transport protein ExbD